jgi:hypothetical protein
MLHIHVLMGTFSVDDPPPQPTATDKAEFLQRFTSDDQLRNILAQAVQVETPALTRAHSVRASARLKPGIIAKNVLRIPEGHLEVIFAYLGRCGLWQWKPDLLGEDPDSLYNSALETIALHTFKVAAAGLAYVHMRPNLKHLSDIPLLQKLYRSFVFSYLSECARKVSVRGENILQESNDLANMYARRVQVCSPLGFPLTVVLHDFSCRNLKKLFCQTMASRNVTFNLLEKLMHALMMRLSLLILVRWCTTSSINQLVILL